MTITFDLFLFFLALVCFGIATFKGTLGPINLVAMGLAFCVLTVFVG